MFRIFSDGFGGFFGYMYDPVADLAGGGVLALMMAGLVTFMAWLMWSMGSALMLPLACLLLAVLVAWGITSVNDGVVGPFLVVQPLLMYAWACLCWALFGATEGLGKGSLGFIGWVLLGLAMLVTCCGLVDETEGIGVVTLAASAVIWGCALSAQGEPGQAARMLKYAFRVLRILALAGGAWCVFDALRGKVTVKMPGVETCASVAGVLALACYLVTRADVSFLPPVAVENGVLWAVRGALPVALVGDVMAVLAQAAAALASGAIHVLLSLVMLVFDASAPQVAVPEALGAFLALGLVEAAVAMGGALVVRLRRAA